MPSAAVVALLCAHALRPGPGEECCAAREHLVSHAALAAQAEQPEGTVPPPEPTPPGPVEPERTAPAPVEPEPTPAPPSEPEAMPLEPVESEPPPPAPVEPEGTPPAQVVPFVPGPEAEALAPPRPAAPVSPPPVPEPGAVRLFLDCPACDQELVRAEITFVDFVRDPADADVHALVTSEPTAAGGTAYAARFIGLGRFRGVDEVLRYASPGTDSPDARRRGVAHLLKLGLVRYVAETPLAATLAISSSRLRAATALPVRDPWDLWVFRTSLSGRGTGQRATSLASLTLSLGANRTSARWRLDLSLDGDYTRQRFDVTEGETVTAVSRTATGRAVAARVLAEHWAAGVSTDATTSTFQNYRLRTRVAGGIEYDVFPYSESWRHILTLLYTLGYQTLAYREETIFGRLSERRPDHRLGAALTIFRAWGSASLAASAAQFLTLPSKYRLSAIATLDLRLFRGFSVNVSARVTERRDQISLPRGAATPDQILLQQRELATDYQYDATLGFTYTFGSIFNNVVNPTLRGAGGF